MIQKLIVNADDFGMSQGINIGIILAHTQGILTSTTCMMNMPYATQALTLAKQYPHLGVGVHLVLTAGRPLLANAQSFTDGNGDFRKMTHYPHEQPHPDLQELYQEWKAQIEKFIEISGHKPTHIDSHHHVHLMPGLIEIAEILAKEYDIPMRQIEYIQKDYEKIVCEINFYNQQATPEYFKETLKKHDGYLEVMCHPALVDQRLYEISSYNLKRMHELDIISSQDIKNFIQDHHIQLINYMEIEKVV